MYPGVGSRLRDGWPVEADRHLPASRPRPTVRAGNRVVGRPRRSGYLLVAPYVVLLVVVGLLPAAYAAELAVTSFTGQFSGVTNFVNSYHDFRFAPAFENIAMFLVIWLTALVVFVVGLSLLLHSMSGRVSAAFRFVFYLPAALAGSASVVIWLFLLQPGDSPWDFVLSLLGYKTLGGPLAPGALPFVFALIAFWTGAGTWIIVMYGALSSIPLEVLEAAELDGAGPLQTALKVQLPLIRKWIGLMLVVAFAAGTQLFTEPELTSQATRGLVSPTWSPNQLATWFAFRLDNFNYAAAISVDLLAISLVCACVVVFRWGLFKAD